MVEVIMVEVPQPQAHRLYAINAPGAMTSMMKPGCPADLLPCEIVLMTLFLTSPSLAMPTTCSLFASSLGFQRTTKPLDKLTDTRLPLTKRAWVHDVVQEIAEKHDFLPCTHTDNFPLYRGIKICCFLGQLSEAVSWFPKFSRPQAASMGLPPSWKLTACQSLVLQPFFVDWMLSRCQPQVAEGTDPNRVGPQFEPSQGDQVDFLQDLPIFDVVLLAVFYMWSNHLDLLSYILVGLRDKFLGLVHRKFDFIDLTELCRDLWACPVNYELIDLCCQSDRPDTTLPNFLLSIAAYQWSAPLMTTICDSLAVSPTSFTQWLFTRDHLFGSILEFLKQLPPVLVSPRSLCRWLHTHSFQPDLGFSASIACYTVNATHFLDLFHEHDIKYLHLLWRPGTQSPAAAV